MVINLKISARDWRWGLLLLTVLLFGLVYFTGSNQRLFFWLNHLSRYTGDPLWACLTLFGDALVFPVLLLPWIRKRPDVVVTALLAFMVTALAVQMSPEAITTLMDTVENIASSQIDATDKSFALGYLVLNTMGEKFLKALFTKENQSRFGKEPPAFKVDAY